MNNTLLTLDIVKAHNAELIREAKRYRLAKQSARRVQGKNPEKVHTVRRTSHSDETSMT